MFLSLLVVMSGIGFGILNCILGGQALSSITNISWTCVIPHTSDHKSQTLFSVGIVIVSVISLFVSIYSPCFSMIPNRING